LPEVPLKPQPPEVIMQAIFTEYFVNKYFFTKINFYRNLSLSFNFPYQ
jgi:hypothetical protein